MYQDCEIFWWLLNLCHESFSGDHILCACELSQTNLFTDLGRSIRPPESPICYGCSMSFCICCVPSCPCSLTQIHKQNKSKLNIRSNYKNELESMGTSASQHLLWSPPAPRQDVDRTARGYMHILNVPEAQQNMDKRATCPWRILGFPKYCTFGRLDVWGWRNLQPPSPGASPTIVSKISAMSPAPGQPNLVWIGRGKHNCLLGDDWISISYINQNQR